MISPSKNHETPKIFSTKRKHNYAVAREANIRIKKQKTSTIKNTIKQVTEKEDQITVFTQPYVNRSNTVRDWCGIMYSTFKCLI
jgi:carbamoylphosphate synthase small subunit